MTAPITNNNPILTDHKRAGSSQNEQPSRGGNAATSDAQTAVNRQDDAVNVSNAAQALGGTMDNQGTGRIQNSAQASELAQQIASFFAENSLSALTAHGNGNSELASLLKAG